MALYAIGDLHLSLSATKPMDVFGEAWKNYVQRLEESFSHLHEDDVTVLCGDLSWGMSLEESLEDFRFIDRIPGKKILLVDDGGEDGAIFRRARAALDADSAQQLPDLRRLCPLRHARLVL